MKKLLMFLLLAAGVGALKAEETMDYKKFSSWVNEQKDGLVQAAKRVTFGISLTRTDDMTEDNWRTVIDKFADILNTTEGNFATLEESLKFAHELPQGTGLLFHVGFSDGKEDAQQQ